MRIGCTLVVADVIPSGKHFIHAIVVNDTVVYRHIDLIGIFLGYRYLPLTVIGIGKHVILCLQSVA